ncbi:MAG: hypothetical protein LUD25_04450 [Coriobacteriaceae bacterium]|nr:hypothetical protein [Coriobacteriaceae bacterium]
MGSTDADQLGFESIERRESMVSVPHLEDTQIDSSWLDVHVQRNRLVAALLADRGVLRLISAPHNFGKTRLAHEYAHRLFPANAVKWTDASAPEFLQVLDDQNFRHTFQQETQLFKLLIIDDLPYLDEERAKTLSEMIDALMFDGVEVIVTTVPSCDCLRHAQIDRILLTANDLLVSKEECGGVAEQTGIFSNARTQRDWEQAERYLFGRTPTVFWQEYTEEGRAVDALPTDLAFAAAQRRCLVGFFKESLPIEVHQAVLFMLLVGHGTFDAAASYGYAIPRDIEALLMNDYPFLGIDPIQHTFSVPEYALSTLAGALMDVDHNDVLLQHNAVLLQKALSYLFQAGDMQRSAGIIETLCPDALCVSWLSERGWDLLDYGEAEFVDSLFEHCDDELLLSDPLLLSLYVWTCGLLGNAREALFYADKALTAVEEDSSDPGPAITARLASTLALFAFAQEDEPSYKRQPIAGDTIDGPETFLAQVVDLCSDVELARAFCMPGSERDKALQVRRKDASARKLHSLEHLFTEWAERIQDSVQFRVALHLLQFVDSEQAHKLLCTLGTDSVVVARRHGLQRLSEATLVCALWRNGYFGLAPQKSGARDARLLEETAKILHEAAELAGNKRFQAPWEPKPTGKRRKKDDADEATVAVDDVPRVRVCLFGGFAVTVGDRRIPEQSWRKRARDLLSLLVLAQGRDMARDRLFEVLWPDTDHHHALDSFYTAWSTIGRVLGGGPYLERSGEFCRINPRYFSSDVADFDQLVRTTLVQKEDGQAILDSCARLEAIYKSGLLPSENDIQVIKTQRDRYQEMYVNAMISATNIALERRDVHTALWFSGKALDSDDRREDVYLAVMRAQVAGGQRCSAIKTYFRCKGFLRNELGLDPSSEMEQLYRSLIEVDPSLMHLDEETLDQMQQRASEQRSEQAPRSDPA